MRLLFLMLLFGLSACGQPLPPEDPPSNIESYPEMDDGPFAIHVATAEFPGTIAETRNFLDTDSRLLLAMPDTDKIARPVSYVQLKGESWPSEGAARRLKFSDGHYALERVTEYTADRFGYQVWGFTSATSKNVKYIHGVQELSQNSQGGTDFTWTYKVRPTANWKHRFVQSFVDKEVGKMIDTATRTVEAQAAEEGTP